ncbi:MAG: cysteine desulfurase family protein [Verrucomicrobiales bacterium]
MRTVYFDYNATTPLDPVVREEMRPYFEQNFGNPSSIHHVGRQARAALDDARDRVARVLKAKPSEIHFTSGGTESNNMAIFGAARMLQGRGKHLITSQVEHHSTLHCFQYLERKEGYKVTYLPVDNRGRVDPEALKRAITPQTTLVSVMAANNEVGTIQPVAELGAICHEHKVFFHTDAAQWFGKELVGSIHDFQADLVTICAHKFHGPKGAGVLFIKSPLNPDPILFGGGHENERRAGTENVPAIMGMAKAVELFAAEPVFNPETLRPMAEKLALAAAAIEGVELQGDRDRGLANTVSFTVQGCDSIGLMAGLDLEGICASSGSACSAGSLEPSHVLTAMGVARNLANSFVRFSLGRESVEEEVSYVIKTLPKVISLQRG